MRRSPPQISVPTPCHINSSSPTLAHGISPPDKTRATLGRLADSFGQVLRQSVHVSFVLPKTKRTNGFTVGNMSVGHSGAWTLARKGHDLDLAVVLDKLEHVSCCGAHAAGDLKTLG